jgi:hypothetical protein
MQEGTDQELADMNDDQGGLEGSSDAAAAALSSAAAVVTSSLMANAAESASNDAGHAMNLGEGISYRARLAMTFLTKWWDNAAPPSGCSLFYSSGTGKWGEAMHSLEVSRAEGSSLNHTCRFKPGLRSSIKAQQSESYVSLETRLEI